MISTRPLNQKISDQFFRGDLVENIVKTGPVVFGILILTSFLGFQVGPFMVQNAEAQPDTPSSDIFGVAKIYPTKTNGNTWYMDMNNPASDPRFDPKTTITKNPDGSWKMKNSKVRMSVYSTDEATYENTDIPTFSRTQLANKGHMQLPSDWKNFEMTGYIKLNSGSNDDFSWYGRGGKHNDSNGGCEGSSYKGLLDFDGGTRFAKENYHVNYDFSSQKSSTPSLFGKWTGFKYIVYNQPGVNFAQKVHQEIWVDVNESNNWVKADSFVDDGFGSGANHCGSASANNMPMTWGGPITTFRVDHANDFDFKYLSVREIQDTASPTPGQKTAPVITNLAATQTGEVFITWLQDPQNAENYDVVIDGYDPGDWRTTQLSATAPAGQCYMVEARYPSTNEYLRSEEAFIDTDICQPPESGDWEITSDCTLQTSSTVSGNVIVQNNSVLTILNGKTLDINFATKNLTVKYGSGVLIESGGRVT